MRIQYSHAYSTYFRNSKEPYSITIAGQVIYIVTSPEDVQTLYKSTLTISWLRFIQDLYRWIGIPQSKIDSLWRVPSEPEKVTYPVQKLPPTQRMSEYHTQQLLPGEKLDTMTQKFLSYVDERLRWQELYASKHCILESSSDSVKLSLMDWTADVFIRASTEIYWGKSIWKVAPNLIDAYLQWEETSWKYVFQLPRFFSRDMYAAKDQLLDGFAAYFGQQKDKREDATYFVTMTEEELRGLAFSDHDVGKVNMLQYWG